VDGIGDPGYNQFELRRAWLFRDSKLEGRTRLDDAVVAERTEEMIEKSLRLAFSVSAQRLREAQKLTKSVLQLLSPGDMVTKSVSRDKPLCSVPI
jgi:hypothetical protein